MVNKVDTKVVVNDITTGAAYSDWPFKSLHFWGENPSGTWKITVAPLAPS